MRLRNALVEVRQNLKSNLWHLINGEPLDYFKFGEYLVRVLIIPGRKIIPQPLNKIMFYADELNKEYAEILDYLHQNVKNGDIIALEQYVKDKVNGSFTDIIKDFVYEYECYENNHN